MSDDTKPLGWDLDGNGNHEMGYFRMQANIYKKMQLLEWTSKSLWIFTMPILVQIGQIPSDKSTCQSRTIGIRLRKGTAP